MLMYADPLPLVQRLFGTGGILAWITLGIYMLKPERREDLRRRFDRSVLRKRRTTCTMLLALGATILTIVGSATIEIDFRPGDSDDTRLVAHVAFPRPNRSSGTPVKYRSAIERGQVKRYMRWPSWFGRTIVVKAQGYPSVEVKIAPLTKTRLRIPESFRQRPIVLIAFSGPVVNAMQDQARDTAFVVNVCVNGHLRVTVDDRGYQGSPILMGDSDVDVQSEWSDYGQPLTRPPDATNLPLAFGERLRAYVWETDRDHPFARGFVTLSELGGWKNFAYLLLVSTNDEEHEGKDDVSKQAPCDRPHT